MYTLPYSFVFAVPLAVVPSSGRPIPGRNLPRSLDSSPIRAYNMANNFVRQT
jgi:hypothetical protein